MRAVALLLADGDGGVVGVVELDPGHQQDGAGDGQHAGAHQGLGAEPGPGEADHDAISSPATVGARGVARLAHVGEDHVLQGDRPDGPGRVEDRAGGADQQRALLAGVAFLDDVPARRERAGVTAGAGQPVVRRQQRLGLPG